MEFDQNKVRRMLEEDRLSNLPDELIHKILSSIDMKFVVQTCLLSSRWKLLWTTMTCLNFSSGHFGTLSKFGKFVTHVLSNCKHEVEVSSVKLHFRGALTQGFFKKISKYAFSHNVQELSVVTMHNRPPTTYRPCPCSSRSLKHLTMSYNYMQLWDSSKPLLDFRMLDFPALTTLELSYIKLGGDLFSKFVNLKNLILEYFRIMGTEEVFDIISPRLLNLKLIKGNYDSYVKTFNVIAPQLENLSVIDCKIDNLNVPPGLSSLYYTSWAGISFVHFCNYSFHSLNKVSLCLSYDTFKMEYNKEDARKILNMFHKLQSARYLTLNAETVECISSFPDLLSQHSSPFSNLIRLTFDSNKRKSAYKVKMSTELARNFLLENSPNCNFIMK